MQTKAKKERQSPLHILGEGRGPEMGTNVGERVKIVQGITSPAGCSRVGPATDGHIAQVPSQGLVQLPQHVLLLALEARWLGGKGTTGQWHTGGCREKGTSSLASLSCQPQVCFRLATGTVQHAE